MSTLLSHLKRILGVLLMITTNASAAPSFKLMAPQYYFTNRNTLSLLSAAMAGDESRAKQLVTEGANPNDEGPPDNKYHRLRLLHYAIAANNQGAVKVLISVGADPELSVQGFGEAFLFVMTLKNAAMMSLLLDLCTVQKMSRSTLKALMFESINQPCASCLEMLLDHGAPIDFPDDAGYTIMMAAMDAQDYDLAEWLLLKGASVNIEAGGGMTPAYSVQFHLNQYKPGSPTYSKVLRLKELMEERGAVFPVATPAEVLAKGGKR